MTIEEIVLGYLSEKLNVPVYTEMPEEQPEEFVLISKTGSAKSNFINSATIAIKSHACSLYSAAELNEDVKKAMENMIELDTIGSSRLNTDYEFTDTTKKKYRYQAIFDLIY